MPPTTCFSTAREGGRSPAQIIPLITVSTTASLEYQAGSPLSRPLADQPRIVPARSGTKISPGAATTPIRSSMLVLRAGLLSERRPCAAPRSSRSSAQASGRERPDWLLLEICPPTTEAGDIRTMRSSRSRQASKPPTGAKITAGKVSVSGWLAAPSGSVPLGRTASARQAPQPVHSGRSRPRLPPTPGQDSR